MKFVTGNKNKLAEFQHTLGQDFEGIDLEIPEIQGEPEQVIAHKAAEAARLSDEPVFVEDTSLKFQALNGLPGPYIKDFINKIGLESVYKLLDAWDDKSAVAGCYIAYAEPGKEPRVFVGETRGTIVAPRGNGWGWDNIFVPEGSDKTYGQKDAPKRCFRTKAIEQFRYFLDGE